MYLNIHSVPCSDLLKSAHKIPGSLGKAEIVNILDPSTFSVVSYLLSFPIK